MLIPSSCDRSKWLASSLLMASLAVFPTAVGNAQSNSPGDTRAAADSNVNNGPLTTCHNGSAGDEDNDTDCEISDDDPTCGGRDTGSGSEPDFGTEACEDSFADAVSLVYQHFGLDYGIDLPQRLGPSGCVPCGEARGSEVGGLPRLEIKRVHKENRSLYTAPGSASFGINVGLSIDIGLGFKTDSNGGVIVQVDDFGAVGAYYILKDSTDGVNDGIFPGEDLSIIDFRMFAAGGVLTGDLSLAETGEINFVDGRRYTFDVFDEFNGKVCGRVTRREDRNGNAIVIDYLWPRDDSDPAMGTDRRRLWIKDTVTDAYGNQAVFSYDTSRPAGWGRYVVDQIDLPNGEVVKYTYNERDNTGLGRLTGVEHADGTNSTFDYGFDADTNTDTIQIYDPAADGTHRTKTAHFTPNGTAGGGQPVGRIRKVVNGAGETSYAIWTASGPSGQNITYAFQGGNQIRRFFHVGSQLLRSENAVTVVATPNGFEYPDGWEVIQAFSRHRDRMPRDTEDALGRTTLYRDLDFSRRIYPRVVHPDNTTSITEHDTAFNWVTRETDRLGRVTDYQLDARGNRLSKTEAFGTADAATWSWTYNSLGQPLTATDANGNVTEYFYSPSGSVTAINNNAGGYLVRKLEPSDTPGGPRAEFVYGWDVANGGLLTSVTDPLGRVVSYVYDERNRVTSINYFDGSNETYAYGSDAPGGGEGDGNLIVSMTDRNGNLTRIVYDDHGHKIEEIVADGSPVEERTTWLYLYGTNDLVLSRTRFGETTTNEFDGYNRRVATTVQPNGGTALTSTRSYDGVRRMRTEVDAYGRGTFYLYDINDRLIRTVQETVPGAITLPAPADSTPADVLANDAYLAGLSRATGSNVAYLLSDSTFDAEGQVLSRTDGRGITDTFTYDIQGRRTSATEASGSAVAARSETVYDPQGNVIEVKTPRVFDTGPEGNANARTVMTYTGRNLMATRTEAPTTAEAATTSYVYNLDKTLAEQTDARGNAWARLWGECCARIMAVIDPPADVDGDGDLERSATVTRHDFYGNLTHEGRVEDVDQVTFPNFQATGSNSTDLPDAGTLSETTTRFDARHRPIASTRWLVPLGSVDPDNVPIAGGGQSGDPAVTIGGEVQGLTTTYAYDDDLTDGQGLEVAHTTAINDRLGAGFFTTGSDGYAVAMTNPEGETTVRFSDAAGRTVLTVDPTGDASSVDYDTVVTLAGFGDVVQTTSADPLDHQASQRSDGVGRTLETEDQLGFVTTYAYDANSNLVSFRDPNGVGEDCSFDLRDRKELCQDTQEIAEGTSRVYGYDANNNLVLSRDAAGTDDTCVYDARDRKTVCTDRVGAVTVYAYDPNSNLASITDGEGGLTSYTYDARNLQTLTVYPNDGEQPGGLDPVGGDRVAMAYDGLRRPSAKTDQAAIVTGFGYDLAGRMIERSYSTDNDADPATPPVLADTDTVTYDLASRPLELRKGRYGNRVAFGYTDDGLIATESLTLEPGTPGNAGSTDRSFTLTRGYDADDRLTSIAYPSGGGTVSQTFTDRNQLQSVSRDGAAVISAFAYDPGMRETRRDLGNGLTRQSMYGRADNLITEHAVAGRPELSLTYAYEDPNKNLTKETRQGIMAPATFTAAHDPGDRLIGWDRTSGETRAWNLSLVGDWDSYSGTADGNAFTQTRTHNPVHEIQNVASDTTAPGLAGGDVEHDAKGNIIEESSAGQVRTYTFDADNMLATASVTGGGANAGSYTYDALGRRVTKTTASATTVFVSLSDPNGSGMGQVIQEYDDASSTPSRQYVYGSYVDEPLAQVTASGDLLFYHRNRHFNVVGLTDASGVTVELYRYTPYGNQTILAADGVTVRTASLFHAGQTPGHQGLHHDLESGLIYNRARYRHTELGRWMGRDPIGYVDNQNFYAVTGGEVLFWLDPTGLEKYMRCVRCWKLDKNGARTGDWKQTCSINDTNDPSFSEVATTNDYPSSGPGEGNSPSETPGDPYGTNGPLEPGDYELTRHPMGRRWGSPPVVTNHPTKPNDITTSKGTRRSNVMIHRQINQSNGCITTTADFCRAAKDAIDDTPGGRMRLEVVDAGDCPCPI